MPVTNHKTRLSAATLLAMLLGSYLYAAPLNAAEFRDISKINGGIRIAAEERVGDLSSINGGISLAQGAKAYDVGTVNGGIVLDDRSSVGDADTVNGGIRVGEDVMVSGSLSSVNGRIRTEAGTVVENSVSTVNGTIQLRNTRVGEDVETTRGDIEIRDGSTIEGDVVVKGTNSWWTRIFRFTNKPSELTIDASSVVLGDIHLYRPVNLHIDADAQVGDIIEHF